MTPEQKQLIREKWLKREKDNELWKIIDSADDVADFWLNEIDLAIKQTEERIVREIEEMKPKCTCMTLEKHNKHSCGTLTPTKNKWVNRTLDSIITLITHK